MVEFPFPDDVSDNPRPAISQFIEAVRDFIAEFVESGKDPTGAPLFEEALLDLMRPAFKETMPAFDALLGRTTELSDESIGKHALSGDSLRFKFSVVNHRVAEFRQRPNVGRFRWVLDTIEGVLDSIIDAAGTGGAVKELKEAIRNSTKGRN